MQCFFGDGDGDGDGDGNVNGNVNVNVNGSLIVLLGYTKELRPTNTSMALKIKMVLSNSCAVLMF